MRRRSKGVRWRRLLVEPLEDRSLLAAVITVNSTSDTNSRDDVITLREALLLNRQAISVEELTSAEKLQLNGAPATGVVDTIAFNIPGTGVRTISLTSPLPAINDSTVIDGYTQPGTVKNSSLIGWNGQLLVELNGANQNNLNGLAVTAGHVTVRGLVINRFKGAGIDLSGLQGECNITGNIIGADATGMIARGNGRGVSINSKSNTIGGGQPEDRNIISGNNLGTYIGSSGYDNFVRGNYIGTNASGTAALGNSIGIEMDTTLSNLIGGAAAGQGNVISGNTRMGIWLTPHSKGAVIQGNLIGTNAAGTLPLGNDIGIYFDSSANNLVGGTASGTGNVISGNTTYGVGLDADGGPGQTNSIQGNRIGTDISGTLPLGNGKGIYIGDKPLYDDDVDGITDISGNTIAFNAFEGILLGGFYSPQNSILGNSIFSNGTLGIDLSTLGVTDADGASANDGGDVDVGPNNLQNFPEFVLASLDAGRLTLNYAVRSAAGAVAYPLRIEFFKADADGQEGQIFLGFDEYTTAEDQRTKTVTLTPTSPLAVGDKIVATATDAAGNTSEFSASISVRSPLFVVNTADSGVGSLREAITLANSTAGTDTISFNIPGTGVQTISPRTALPSITEAVTIDGYTQPGAMPNTNGTELGLNTVLNVELDGSLIDEDAVSGLVSNSNDVTVRGLAIHGFSGAAVALNGVSSNKVEGNFLGTNASGVTDTVTANIGVEVLADLSTIGGPLPAQRNLISGNRNSGVKITSGAYNLIAGNLIGLDVTGTKAIGVRSAQGVLVEGGYNNVIGGFTTAVRNIISANTVGVSFTTGLNLYATENNSVLGNFIGTDITGTVAVGNATAGVEVNGNSFGNKIGGIVAGAGNLISGNGGYGIHLGYETTSSCASAGFCAVFNAIQGNYVGTDATGTRDLGNGQDGVNIDGGSYITLVGGTTASVGLLGMDSFSGNLISGNDRDGIRISAVTNRILGNLIGTSRTGQALGNAGNGVAVVGGVGVADTTIGAANEFFWPVNEGGNGHYYGLGPPTLWLNAESRAFSMGGHLISIDNQAEQDFIVSTFLSGAGANETFWIGAEYISDNEYQWSSGKKLTYTNWNPDAPDNLDGLETVGVINWHHSHVGGTLGTWNDVPGTGRDNAGMPEDYRGIMEFSSNPGNTIAFNGRNGILIEPANPVVIVVGNSIFANAALGIDLDGDGPTRNDAAPTPDADDGANRLQNYPETRHATRDAGKLTLTYTVPSDPANSTYPIRVEFFQADAAGAEGQVFLGEDIFTVADYAGGNKTVTLALRAPVAFGDKIVATATDSLTGGRVLFRTSEFSPSVVVASSWLNPERRWDVTGDKHVVADDVLAIINYINAKGSGKIPVGAVNEKPYCDVNGDNSVAADDVIEVINYINAGFGGEGEERQVAAAGGIVEGDEWLALVAMDVAGQVRKKR